MMSFRVSILTFFFAAAVTCCLAAPTEDPPVILDQPPIDPDTYQTKIGGFYVPLGVLLLIIPAVLCAPIVGILATYFLVDACCTRSCFRFFYSRLENCCCCGPILGRTKLAQGYRYDEIE